MLYLQRGRIFMKNIDLALLKHSELFHGIEEGEISSMLACLSAETKSYERGAYVLRYGERANSVGIVLSGRVSVVREDYWGNRNIVSAIEPGETFAESYACAENTALSVSIQADEASQVLWMDVRKILTACSSACEFHNRLIRNLVSLLAKKNLGMNRKLLSYLSSESMRQKSPSFTIPFDRQQLADYLSVDRSAMSNELSKLRREGVLEYEKNRFTILETGERNI
jgi:CRP-like cAMP-binding protein